MENNQARATGEAPHGQPTMATGADPDCTFDRHGYCSAHRQMRLCWSYAHGPDAPLPRSKP